jgi:N-acetyl-alpha-D-glucosaminyl L-malate synthase BshA
VQDVVKVFASVRKQMPAKLLMVGDGPERPVMEDMVKEYEVGDDVRFLGKQEQMEEILVVSDLFVLPSEYESFGLAALEAMAASMPVVSTNSGGLPEVNIDGKTGCLSDVGDVAAMTENAIKILRDDTTLATFKQNAYEQARRFDIHNIVPVYEKLYSRFCTMDCE